MVERKIQPLRLNIAGCVGGECNLKWTSLSSHLPVMVYPLAASSPAMYSPSLLLCEQPHVFTYTDCVPGMKL